MTVEDNEALLRRITEMCPDIAALGLHPVFLWNRGRC